MPGARSQIRRRTCGCSFPWMSWKSSLDAAIGVYNGTPHDGLNGRTPLEAIEHGVRGRGAMLNWLPEAKRRTLCLMQTPRRAIVRGYLHQGQRPHVNFHGVRYSNRVLASTAAFLGQELRIYYNSQDLRTVRAFGADGVEVGVLKAQGAWGEIAHDLKLRQEIVRLRGRKRLASALSQEFLQQFIAGKLQKANRGRRAGERHDPDAASPCCGADDAVGDDASGGCRHAGVGPPDESRSAPGPRAGAGPTGRAGDSADRHRVCRHALTARYQDTMTP